MSSNPLNLFLDNILRDREANMLFNMYTNHCNLSMSRKCYDELYVELNKLYYEHDNGKPLQEIIIEFKDWIRERMQGKRSYLVIEDMEEFIRTVRLKWLKNRVKSYVRRYAIKIMETYDRDFRENFILMLGESREHGLVMIEIIYAYPYLIVEYGKPRITLEEAREIPPSYLIFLRMDRIREVKYCRAREQGIKEIDDC